MLIEYEDKTLSYILGVEGLKKGDKVISGDKNEIEKGFALLLKNIPALILRKEDQSNKHLLHLEQWLKLFRI